MRIGVIGTGHVGLVTVATMAALGHDAVGHDADAEKMAALKAGRAPFYEPRLQDLLDSHHGENLAFTDDPSEAIAESETVFICVGTPARASGEANLIAVERAAVEIARRATTRCVVVEKSTVPAGTATRLRQILLRESLEEGPELEVVSNPEFLREGRAVEDSLNPDRILVGAESVPAFATMRAVYKPLLDKGVRLIETDIRTAELAKHASNAFLALKISYANALARLCEASGADVVKVAEVMGADPRIGNQFLEAGLGFGGYCFPKDIQAFERLAHRVGYDFPLLKEVERINAEAIDATLKKVEEALWNLEGKRVAMLGLAYKPGTDDVRFSPALALARRLIAEGATVVGCDPQASSTAKADLPELEIAPDAYEAAAGAHCLVLATDWAEFEGLDLARIKEILAYPVVIDGRNLFDPVAMKEHGFTYYPTGRPPVA